MIDSQFVLLNAKLKKLWGDGIFFPAENAQKSKDSVDERGQVLSFIDGQMLQIVQYRLQILWLIGNQVRIGLNDFDYK